MFRFPFGTTQELNLDWFLEQWEIFKQEAQTALGGIDHALDAEIQRVEDAMTDLYAARDAAIAAKNDALNYAQSANSSAIGASQSAQNSAASAVTSAQQAQSAAQSATSAQSSATNAGTSAGNALTQAQQSEAWATGEIGGVHVPPTAPQNLNNAKQYATNAQLSANAANTAKNDARAYSQDSKAWATGIRDGEPVTSEDETYQNNAKYYAESISGDAAAAAQSASAAAASAASVGQSANQIAQNTADIEDLKSSLSNEEIVTTALDGVYVDDGRFTAPKDNCKTYVIDLTTIDRNKSITVVISGNQNRARCLLSTSNASDVESGVSGTYINQGDTTKRFTLTPSQWNGFNSLSICTNYLSTPYATLYALALIDVGSLEEDVDTLFEDVNSIYNRIGVYDTLTFAYNGDHPSDNDILVTRIKEGKEFTVSIGVTGGQTWCQLFAIINGVKTKIGNYTIATDFPITLTATGEITGLSVYFIGTNTGTITLTVISEGTLKDEIVAEFNNEVTGELINARHINGNVSIPLTILHFSDLHSEAATISRIVAAAEEAADFIDDIICTGDMVANSYSEIASWWDANVLTCIGNHDTASYSVADGYNWTALSMADRDAYYIAPFESNWSIVHTVGTSYYYKDYTDQKVRMIVMDGMLYSSYEPDTSLGTVQTAWLANLLSDAITNNLHVLIAIHAPHGGATAIDCSFGKYGQGTMPINNDCNTPQVVVDTVANAINNGLHFIGYLVGHAHQDNMWDAEGDGKQLMYCVTCAAVGNVNQWKNSDQFRSYRFDAYNLVTIDTTNTLVKIVRGGGADIDDHMRTRKAICFNYSTGEKVGEVL